jgi:glycosyltransferase involved in cell wall biosynthesis
MKLSVIICTHNPREDYLRRVLDGLRAQTLPLADWELLVVDNGSKFSVAERFDVSWHPHARHVREEELGLTPARLRGIREASADTLVFVDDDNVLAPDYLVRAVQVGDEWPFVGAWGGSIEPEFESPVPSWVGDQLWRVSIAAVKEDVWSNLREGYATMPYGAGLCVRKPVGAAYLNRCLDQKKIAVLDRKGRELTGYGDIDLAHCAMDIGLGIGKTPRLKLIHLIPASRLTLDYFLRHAEGDAMSMLVFRASRGLPFEKPRSATWLHRLRWYLHRLKKNLPREQYEITKAYDRGIRRGYELASEYLKRRRDAGLKDP